MTIGSLDKLLRPTAYNSITHPSTIFITFGRITGYRKYLY